MSEEGKKAALAIAEQMRLKDERIAELQDALALVLPMAKGYAHANRVGRNAQMVAQADEVLAKAGPR